MAKVVVGGVAGSEDAEAEQGLALGVVGDAQGYGFGDGGVGDEEALDFGGAEAFAGDLEGVIGAAEDVPLAVGVDAGEVAVDPEVGAAGEVGVEIALSVVPEAAGHADPGGAEDEFADLPDDGVAGVVDDIGGHAGEGAGEAAGALGGEDVAAEDAAGDFGAAGVVEDGACAAADVAEEVEPGVWVPGFAGGAELAEGGEVGLWGRGRLHEGADEGGGDAEGGDALGADEVPESAGVGVVGGAVVEDHGGAEEE